MPLRQAESIEELAAATAATFVKLHGNFGKHGAAPAASAAEAPKKPSVSLGVRQAVSLGVCLHSTFKPKSGLGLIQAQFPGLD